MMAPGETGLLGVDLPPHVQLVSFALQAVLAESD
jgi:hypothetical protein